jgi:hypothetical protein
MSNDAGKKKNILIWAIILLITGIVFMSIDLEDFMGVWIPCYSISLGLFAWRYSLNFSAKSEYSGDYGLGSQKKLKTNRHEMLRNSLFGETPVLVIKDSQPLVLTHEMIKRTIENLGFSTHSSEGPSLIESKDGWEQIGGDFNGTRYGIWVSPSKLSLIFTSFAVLLIGSIFLIVFGAQGEDVLLISGIVLLLVSLGLLGWYIYLIVLMNKSRIEVDMIYMGFRKEKNKRKKLGKPLLDSIIKDLGQANDMMTLPNLSEFLDGISDFDTDKNLHDKLQLSISYSLHTKLTNNKSVLERDFTLLRDGLLQSMVVSSKEFTPIFKDPQFIHTETQIHKKEEEFSTLSRFPVKLSKQSNYQNTNEPFSNEPPKTMSGAIHDGREWLSHMGKDWYRKPGSNSEWTLHDQ